MNSASIYLWKALSGFMAGFVMGAIIMGPY
jgi:hypothetical protein